MIQFGAACVGGWRIRVSDMAFWIGLTGGIGSGKSAVAQCFADLGVPRLDADAIGRELTASDGMALPEIRRVFGDAVFDESGALRRDALRETVFASAARKQQLETLMLPLIFKEIVRRKADFEHEIFGVVEIPLLVEKPAFMHLTDRVLSVSAPLETRISRVMQRSSLTREAVLDIMKHQTSERERLLRADDVLNNDSSLTEMHEKVARLCVFYTGFFAGQTARNGAVK